MVIHVDFKAGWFLTRATKTYTVIIFKNKSLNRSLSTRRDREIFAFEVYRRPVKTRFKGDATETDETRRVG